MKIKKKDFPSLSHVKSIYELIYLRLSNCLPSLETYGDIVADKMLIANSKRHTVINLYK